MVGIFSRKLSRTIGQLVRFWRTQTSLLIWRWQEPVHVMFCRSAENKRPYVTWPIPFFGFSRSCINLGIRGLCDTSVSIQRGKNYEGNSQIQQTGDSKAYHSLIYLFFSCFICLKIQALIGLLRLSDDRRWCTVAGGVWWLGGGHIWIAWMLLFSSNGAFVAWVHQRRNECWLEKALLVAQEQSPESNSGNPLGSGLCGMVPARSQQCFLMFYLFWSLLQHFGIVIQETFLIMVHFLSF